MLDHYFYNILSNINFFGCYLYNKFEKYFLLHVHKINTQIDCTDVRVENLILYNH